MTDSLSDVAPRGGAGTPQDAPHETPTGRTAGRATGRRHWLRWALIAVAVVFVAWLVWRLLHPAKPTPPPRATPVGVAKVTTGDLKVELQAIGTVTPVATVTVQTQISGRLFQVGFQEGQIVHKGQLLDLIDPRPYEIALAQAQGTLVHDQALLAQARSDLARYEILAKQDSIAKQVVADQEFLVRQDTGTVMNDEAAIRSDRLNIEYCHIVAPVTGRVGLRLVDPGNYVQSGSSTGLVVVTQLQPITVIMVLPEDDIPAVSQQMATGAPLEVSAYDRTGAKLIARGRLTTIDNTVDTTTGTVKLRATFPNTDLALFPNEFVNGHLLLKTLNGVTEVPTRAVQQGAPGTFVYVVKSNNTVAVQVIKTGVTDGENVQVLSGLTPGQTVVVDGVDQLRAGAKVKITPEDQVKRAPANNGPGAPPGEQPQNARPPTSSR